MPPSHQQRHPRTQASPRLLRRRIDATRPQRPPLPSYTPPEDIMEPAGGGERYPCSCFSCTDGGRRGPRTVSWSTWFNHNTSEKRRRMSQGRSDYGTAGCEPDAMPESLLAGGPSDMGLPAASVSNAGVEAAAARVSGGSGRRWDADVTPELSETCSIAAVPILSTSAENRTTAGQLLIGCRSESEHIIGGESCFAHFCSCAQRTKLGQEQ